MNKQGIKIPPIIKAIYAEKGYYLWVTWLLLISDMVTTYGQKGYYFRLKHLFASCFSLIRVTFKGYSTPE